MNISGDVMFREFLCSGIKCTGTKYESCTMDMHFGNCIPTKLRAYPSYETYKRYADCKDDNVSVCSTDHNR